MTDPKNPLGGSTPDDFDALLDALSEPGDADTENRPSPSGDVPRTTGPIYQPPPRMEANDLDSIFEDEVDVPTRMVDAEEMKRQAGEVASTGTGLDAVFAPRPSSVQPAPTAAEAAAAAADIPSVLTVPPPALAAADSHDPFADLALSDEEVAKRAGSSPAPATDDAATPPPAPLPKPPVGAAMPRPPLGGPARPAVPAKPSGFLGASAPRPPIPGSARGAPIVPPRSPLGGVSPGGAPPRMPLPLPRPPIAGKPAGPGAVPVPLPRPPGSPPPAVATPVARPVAPPPPVAEPPAAEPAVTHDTVTGQYPVQGAEPAQPINVPPPIESPELAALALDVDEARGKPTARPPAVSASTPAPATRHDEASFEGLGESGDLAATPPATEPEGPSLDAGGEPEEAPSLEVGGEDEGPSIDSSAEDEGPALDSGGDDEGPSLDASSDDDGPIFETEEGEDTVLEVGGEEEVEVAQRVEDDRGAQLAASVTSRRRWLEPAEIAYAGDARAEVEARAGLLEGEAEHADSPARAAEMLSVAGELVEGVLGDRARARALYERAYEAAPDSPFVLRALRRLALVDDDVQRARELTDQERALELSDEDRIEVTAFAAELDARQDTAAAEVAWEGLVSAGGIRGSIAQLMVGGSRHDFSVMGSALETLGQNATGAFGAAASLARARLAEGASEADTALTAVQASVQRDPNDVTSWLAMARIAIGRENANVFRDALAGLARTAADSAAGWAATALDASAGAVLAGVVAPITVPTAGVGGWLVAHALRDSGHDEAPQIQASLEAGNDAQKAVWSLLTPEGSAASASDVGRFLVLRRAVAQGDVAQIATAAAALLGGDDSEGPVVHAAMLATKGALAAEEVAPLSVGDAFRRPELAAMVIAGTEGVDAAEAKIPPRTEAASEIVAAVERALRATNDVDAARAGFESVRDSDGPAAPRVYAARQLARLSGELTAFAEALHAERSLSPDAPRTPGTRFLAAAIGAGLALEGAADEALEASRALPGELAAAELAAVFGLRGEINPADASAVLQAAAGDGSTLSQQTAAVRASLRLAGTEPDAAADALFKIWNQAKQDGVLSALTLRALPHEDIERRVAVIRNTAERAETAGPVASLTAWTLVAQSLSDAGQPGEAAKALARARTFDVADPALRSWEENLWLSAGMFAEVAERSFEALKAAESDEARIAAYERLAELDSAFRNDVASAVLTYQAILELAPGHMASLRTLERYFLEQGRFEELLGIYDRLIHHVADPLDATAIGHAAARIAIKQAENDQSAGAPFWAAAFERGAPDLRTVVALDAEARRGGDAKRFIDVMLRGESLASDPRERATFATRAAEAYLGLGDSDAALAALERAREAHPNHPVALAWTAFLREQKEDFVGAAESYEAISRASKLPVHSVASMLRAAILWQEKADNVERARIALREVLNRDPSNAEAFDRSLKVMKGQGDKQAELDVLEGRIRAGGDPSEIMPLQLRMAELAEEIGDLTRARTALRAVLVIDADKQEALRSLARLSRTTQDWTAAADAMIKLVRLSQDANERNEIMYGLGEVFDLHLNDPKRAEAAYKRVLQMLPNDVRTLTRLADLYARTDNAAAEAESLRQLVQTTPASATRRALQIRLAAVFSEKQSEAKKAEEVLEAARRDAPTDMDVLRAFARLYVRQEAPMALVVLLDRATGDVRRTLDADLTNAQQLELLTDILKLRGRVDGARVVGAVAQGLAVPSEKLAILSKDGNVPGAGANALTLEVLDLLAPPTVTNAHRELMRLSADVLEKIVPFDANAVRAEKLGARPHPMRADIERWAKVLGLETIEILLGPATTLLVTPIGRHPPTVMIPIDLKDSHLARFAVARAMIIVALSLPITVRVPSREVTVLIAGLLRQFEPMFLPDGGDPARVDEAAKRIMKVLPRARHPEMSPHAFEVIGSKNTDGDGMAAGVIELANRLAMLASGDIKGAMEALSPPDTTPRASIATAPALGRLVRVAISDRFMEARHLTGADKRSPGT